MKNRLFLSLILLIVFVTGCSNGNSVTGKVTFADGTPLPRGEVTFLTSTFVAAGMIRTDGSYTIHANNMKDGVPAGTYSITVKAYDEAKENPNGMMENLKPVNPLIALKYTNPATSGLTCEVKGATTFDIRLVRKLQIAFII